MTANQGADHSRIIAIALVGSDGFNRWIVLSKSLLIKVLPVPRIYGGWSFGHVAVVAID